MSLGINSSYLNYENFSTFKNSLIQLKKKLETPYINRRFEQLKPDETIEEEVKNSIQEIYRLESNLKEIIDIVCTLKSHFI